MKKQKLTIIRNTVLFFNGGKTMPKKLFMALLTSLFLVVNSSYLVFAAADTTAPKALTIGIHTCYTTSITLDWLAVGDDGALMNGAASSYDIRYMKNTPITESNWASATQVLDEPVPQVAFSQEKIAINGLTPNTTYYFAVKVGDEANNWSGLSNVAAGGTTAVPTIDNPPSVYIGQWSATMHESQTIIAGAGDDAGIKSVEFYVDNVLKYTTTTPFMYYSWFWDITNYSNGTHTLKVVATDTANQTASKQEVVTISKTTNPVPSADTTAPAKVNNLAAGNATTTSITLTWTATGDDGTTGTATVYDIRYSNVPIVDLDHWLSTSLQASGEPTPKAAGSVETFTVNGLSENTMYYFAIRVGDDVSNWSVLSNMPSSKTLVDVVSPTPPVVTNDNPPTINIASPYNGETNVHGTRDIVCYVEDDKGIKKVDIYIDEVLKKTLNRVDGVLHKIGGEEGYLHITGAGEVYCWQSWHWDSTQYTNGSHTVKAVITDDSSQTAEAESTFTVLNGNLPPSEDDTADSNNNEPYLSVMPRDGQEVSGTYKMVIYAGTVDTTGLKKLQIYIDGSLVKTMNKVDGVLHKFGGEGDYLHITGAGDVYCWQSWDWDTTKYTDGIHTLKIAFTDDSDKVLYLETTVKVKNSVKPPEPKIVDSPPEIKIQSPVNGEPNVNGTRAIMCHVTDDNGIAKLDFYVDNVLKTTLTKAKGLSIIGNGTVKKEQKWDLDTTQYANGDHNIKVVVTDTAGQIAKDECTITTKNDNIIVSTVTVAGVGVTADIHPKDTILNPCKGGKSWIAYTIGDKAANGGSVHVTIEIFNANGDLIKTLIDNDMRAGTYQSVWEGKNFGEEVVASGVYIARLRAGKYTASKKMVVIK